VVSVVFFFVPRHLLLLLRLFWAIYFAKPRRVVYKYQSKELMMHFGSEWGFKKKRILTSILTVVFFSVGNVLV
jgi:hypothetical protein